MTFDPFNWFLKTARPTEIKLYYENATNIRINLGLVSGTTIEVNFGQDDTIDVLTSGVYFEKVFGTPVSGFVTIYTANRIRNFVGSGSGTTFWKFPLSQFQTLLSLEGLIIGGDIFGDLSNIGNSIRTIRYSGNGLITGSMSDFSENLIYFEFQTGTVNVEAYTSDLLEKPNLERIHIRGLLSKAYFDLSMLPLGIELLDLRGNGITTSGISRVTYSQSKIWRDRVNTIRVYPEAGYGLSTPELDLMLNDMANSITVANNGFIDLRGNNEPRSAASNDAVTYLQTLNYTVLTN